MSHKQQLETQLWNIANTLRGTVGADEFRDYILGLVFYKYLSERMQRYADELLRPDGTTYAELDEGSATGAEYLKPSSGSSSSRSYNKLGGSWMPTRTHWMASAGSFKSSCRFGARGAGGACERPIPYSSFVTNTPFPFSCLSSRHAEYAPYAEVALSWV